jgi:predicted SAM-dependent methyltransferase
MLKWFTDKVKKHGFVKATLFFRQASWSRLKTIVSNKTLPIRFACPICGWAGRRFNDYIEYIESKGCPLDLECPQCLSHSRHRALYIWLTGEFEISKKSGTLLICAPEKAMLPLWNSLEKIKIIKMDIEPFRGVDVLADLQRLPFADDSQDIIWCHHVLEQIEDDIVALKEIHRILHAETGQLIISSAINKQEKTKEYGYSNSNYFGNWRLYGQDYADRIKKNGFFVEQINHKLSDEKCKKYGIYLNEKYFLCKKKLN